MIIKLTKKLNKALTIGTRSLTAQIVIRQLENNVDEDIRKIASTINFIRKKKNWSIKEESIFKEIRNIRNTYLESHEKIKIEDYGAGDSEEKRSAQQMNDGVSEISSVAKICKSSSSPEKWGKLIFKLIRNLGPVNCLELGTCLGISAAYQLAAIKLNEKDGKLTTIEGAGELARISGITLQSFDYPGYTVLNGRFKDVLVSLLPATPPFDFVFIDGHHDKIATHEYFDMIYPFLTEKAVVIFDDINWSKGMQIVWKEIYNDQRIKMSFDLYKWGICLIDKTAFVDKMKCYKLVV